MFQDASSTKLGKIKSHYQHILREELLFGKGTSAIKGINKIADYIRFNLPTMLDNPLQTMEEVECFTVKLVSQKLQIKTGLNWFKPDFAQLSDITDSQKDMVT